MSDISDVSSEDSQKVNQIIEDLQLKIEEDPSDFSAYQ